MKKTYAYLGATCISLFAVIMLAWILVYQESTALSRARFRQMSGLEMLDYNNSNASFENDKLRTHLRIPYPIGVREEEIKIEVEPADHRVSLEIPRCRESFFYRNPIIGTSEHVTDLVAQNFDQTLYVDIYYDSIYVIDAIFEDNGLYLGITNPRKLHKQMVVIDAGHGDGDPGATSGDAWEADIDLQIAKYTEEYLKEAGIGVFMTRHNGYNVRLSDRVGMANELDADAFVSIHCNSSSFGGGGQSGTQAIYNANDPSGASLKLATECVDYLCEALDSKKLRLLVDEDIHIVRNSKVPVALLEVGFISNKEELDKLLSEGYQRKAAKSIAEAIISSYEKGIIE